MSDKIIINEEIIDEKEFIVELSGLIDNKSINSKLEDCNFLEIESQKPVLQIGNLLFQGSYEPFLGTAVCFQQQLKTEEPSTSSGESSLNGLEFLTKTDLKLKMKRVYLDKKKNFEES